MRWSLLFLSSCYFFHCYCCKIIFDMWEINYFLLCLRRKGENDARRTSIEMNLVINPHSRCRQAEIGNLIQSLTVPFKGLIQNNSKAPKNIIYQTKITPRTYFSDIYSFRYVQKFIKLFFVCLWRGVGCFVCGFFCFVLCFVWNYFDWFGNKPEQNSSEQPVLVDILFQTH